MSKRRYKKELQFIIIMLALIVAYFFRTAEKEVDLVEGQTVEINEEIVLKEYKTGLKSINDISYEDYRTLNISKNKIDSILDYKKYMGSINNIKDLDNIPRITYQDIEKISQFFKDNPNPIYKKHNINNASVKQLKYLGFSNKQIKKILKYRKNNKIKNLLELESIVGKSYRNKSISF